MRSVSSNTRLDFAEMCYPKRALRELTINVIVMFNITRHKNVYQHFNHDDNDDDDDD